MFTGLINKQKNSGNVSIAPHGVRDTYPYRRFLKYNGTEEDMTTFSHEK